MMNGKRSGPGIMKTSCSTYEGGWLEGKKHGQGKETFSDGTIVTAEFINN